MHSRPFVGLFALWAVLAGACPVADGFKASRYNVAVTQRGEIPSISFEGDAHYPGSSPWPQNFNPTWVEASSGTAGVEGLIIRAQNCSFVPGVCTNCNVDAKHPIKPYFPGSVLLFAQHLGGGAFAVPYLVFSPAADAPQDETNGTEDPRVAFDAATSTYHLFYTCYGAKGPILCHATSSNPTAPHPGQWTRLGAVFPGYYGSKSAALLIKPQPPHVLLWGDSSVTPGIAFATSNDLLSFTTINTSFITPRSSFFDSLLVESGPPPVLLSDGNFLFLHNSASVSSNASGSFGSYAVGYVIISSDASTIIQRSQVQTSNTCGARPLTPMHVPLLSPVRDWERGVSPAQCNVHDVVFVEAMRHLPGTVDTFQVFFGGSDAVIGSAVLQVSPA